MSNSSVVYWALNDYGVTVFDIITNVVILVIAFWIIFLNVLVLNALREHRNKEATEYYISNLSVADLLTGIYLIYNTTYNLTNFQIIFECLLRFGLLLAVSICSVFQLVALSADRCIKIVYPFRYADICNKKYVSVIITISWVLALLVGLLPLMGWRNHPETDNTCGFMRILTVGYFRLLLCLQFTPFFLLLIIYLRIFKEAHRHALSITSSEPGATNTTTKHSLKFTKTVSIVAGTYLLCWAPMGTVVILHVSGYLDDYTYLEKGNFIVYSTGPAFLNSLLNPIIYALKVPFIRRRFKRIFSRKGTDQDRVVIPNSTCANEVSKVTVLSGEKLILEDVS
ncbi:hypothetical protein SNE40_011798 [Patella caerulea]|uniref:G-protein coupled receptors family 1 profile domain-containing protein n=1 Tax=Patella caerulea TaxID=87958 RepID=A0AAN8JSZ5_PATCE